MFSGGNSPSLADIAAVTGGNNRNNDGLFGGDGWWAIIIFALIFGWGRGGWGGNGDNGGGNGSVAQFIPYQVGSSYTDSEVQRGFDNAAVQGKLDTITSGISNLGYDMLSQMNGLNQNVSNTGFGIQSALCQGFNGVNAAIAQNGYQTQQCCCDTQKEIIENRYEASKGMADIVNAIKADGDATRALITQNEIQSLREELQTANFQLSQQAQSANLINTLRPTPQPAYITCSPYQASTLAYNSLYGCGCGSCNS